MADMTDKILSTRSPLIPIRNLKLRFIMRGDDHLKIGRAVALAMATHGRAPSHTSPLPLTVCSRRCVPPLRSQPPPPPLFWSLDYI